MIYIAYESRNESGCITTPELLRDTFIPEENVLGYVVQVLYRLNAFPVTSQQYQCTEEIQSTDLKQEKSTVGFILSCSIAGFPREGFLTAVSRLAF